MINYSLSTMQLPFSIWSICGQIHVVIGKIRSLVCYKSLWNKNTIILSMFLWQRIRNSFLYTRDFAMTDFNIEIRQKVYQILTTNGKIEI